MKYKNGMRIVAHIPEELRERLDKYVDEKYGGRHGALSWVVERAIVEYLDHEERKSRDV